MSPRTSTARGCAWRRWAPIQHRSRPRDAPDDRRSSQCDDQREACRARGGREPAIAAGTAGRAAPTRRARALRPRGRRSRCRMRQSTCRASRGTAGVPRAAVLLRAPGARPPSDTRRAPERDRSWHALIECPTTSVGERRLAHHQRQERRAVPELHRGQDASRSARNAATASPRQRTAGPSSSSVRDPRGAGATTPRRMSSSRRVAAPLPVALIGPRSATGVSRSITTKRVPPRTTRRYRDRWFFSSPTRTDLMVANLAKLGRVAQPRARQGANDDGPAGPRRWSAAMTCAGCGRSPTPRCPACGAESEANAQFCGAYDAAGRIRAGDGGEHGRLSRYPPAYTVKSRGRFSSPTGNTGSRFSCWNLGPSAGVTNHPVGHIVTTSTSENPSPRR